MYISWGLSTISLSMSANWWAVGSVLINFQILVVNVLVTRCVDISMFHKLKIDGNLATAIVEQVSND